MVALNEATGKAGMSPTSVLLNLLWIIFGGMANSRRLVAGARAPDHGDLLAITIVGIPFAWAHVKLAGLALWPIGKMIVPA
jgi:uncharacterized membrane protein YccF (DUF307 family)